MSVKCPYVVPRSFHLLDELNMAEKGKYPDKYKKDSGFITLGLSDPEDSSLTRWNSSIIPPQGTIIGDRMYNVIIVCDSSYPGFRVSFFGVLSSCKRRTRLEI